MANHELSKQEALSKAQAYCARAEHCMADVQRKLHEWGVNPDFFDFIEQNLRAEGYVNDVRFCQAYVHDKVAYQSWGRLKIQAGLQALRLPDSAIHAALEDMDWAQYIANLRKLAQSRRTDTQEKRFRFLLQRGFTYEEIKKYSL